jgi:hypothetical protein
MMRVLMAAVQLYYFQPETWESLSVRFLLQSVLQYVDALLAYMCRWRFVYNDAAATG